ncbi:MAG: hypothetical protein M0003_02565 [Acidithiobacillus sp.]|nr:hypothetical protein [Acidithiobacillus sp.]
MLNASVEYYFVNTAGEREYYRTVSINQGEIPLVPHIGDSVSFPDPTGAAGRFDHFKVADRNYKIIPSQDGSAQGSVTLEIDLESI